MSRPLPALACTAALAFAGAFASMPAHADRVAWNVTIGGPGFAVSAGQPWGGFGPVPVVRPVVRPWPRFVAPVPVVVAFGFRGALHLELFAGPGLGAGALDEMEREIHEAFAPPP